MESPLHAWWKVFKEEPEEATDATDIGTIAHDLILGGSDRMAIIDHDDYRTKAAKEARDAARAEGKIPVKRGKIAEIYRCVDSVKDFLIANDLQLTGQSECEIEWEQDGVACAGRIDHHWAPDHPMILDLKFVENAHPESLASACIRYGYDIQAAAYTSALEHLHPELAGRVDFLFVFAEKAPPFAITPVRLGGSMKALGQSRWARAIDLWRHCMEAYGPETPWPSYTDQVERVLAPAWAVAAETEASEKFAALIEGGIEL
jgi:hypothetical protein